LTSIVIGLSGLPITVFYRYLPHLSWYSIEAWWEPRGTDAAYPWAKLRTVGVLLLVSRAPDPEVLSHFSCYPAGAEKLLSCLGARIDNSNSFRPYKDGSLGGMNLGGGILYEDVSLLGKQAMK
jgi:hypothetical protein